MVTALVQAGQGGIIANPNCSTIIALMAVTPIHRAKTVKRMIVSTYQAASGAGQAAMEELEAQTKAVIDGTEVPKNIFPFQYAFNLFSHNAPMAANGYNEEVRSVLTEWSCTCSQEAGAFSSDHKFPTL
jgi:aspartate-semialdehyde dehydrogenase